jgi:hypothetical protein
VGAPRFLPVDAMLPLGPHMLISGGYQGASDAEIVHRLQLWDCRSMTSIRNIVCRCGAVTCLELLVGNPSSSSSTSPSAGQTAMAVPEPASWARSSSSSSSSDAGDTGSSSGGSCRVLSGHVGGQVVLWELQRGRGAAVELRELAVLGEHSKGR